MNTKKKTMIEALKSNLGNISLATQKVGISRKTHYDWMLYDEEYKYEVNNIDEYTIDFTEAQLLKLIAEKNVIAILFYLKTKAKHRGYVENPQVMNMIKNQMNVGPNYTFEIIESNDNKENTSIDEG